MFVVFLVRHFLARDKDIAAAGGNDVVSHVLRGVICGFVFAH